MIIVHPQNYFYKNQRTWGCTHVRLFLIFREKLRSILDDRLAREIFGIILRDHWIAAYILRSDCRKCDGIDYFESRLFALRRPFLPSHLRAVEEEKIRTRGPGAKTVMCRLNVNGDSHLFQPLGRWLRLFACVCARVTNHTRVRVYARLTHKKSAWVLYECHGE